MNNKILSKLVELDDWQKISGLSVESYLHKDHRYCLIPALNKKLKDDKFQPITLIGFDFHHDTCSPSDAALEKLSKFKGSVELETFVKFVDEELKKNDDDWIKAGMELGIIDNAIIFGVKQTIQNRVSVYTDQGGKEHKIVLLHQTPGEMFSFKGGLSDLALDYEFADIWQILGWKLDASTKKFSLNETSQNYWLNIDLDCFIIDWESYTFPWEEIVFNDRFKKDESYGAAKGWTGVKFIEEVLKKANLLTICTEPGCCGGINNSQIILERVNKYMFNNEMNFS